MLLLGKYRFLCINWENVAYLTHFSEGRSGTDVCIFLRKSRKIRSTKLEQWENVGWESIHWENVRMRNYLDEKKSSGKVSDGKMSAGKLSVGKKSDGKVSVGKCLLRKCTNGKMSNGKLSGHPYLDLCWQNLRCLIIGPSLHTPFSLQDFRLFKFFLAL